MIEDPPGTGDIAIASVGGKKSRPGDYVPEGHAIEDGLGLWQVAGPAMLSDQGVVVVQEPAVLGGVGGGRSGTWERVGVDKSKELE